MFTTGSERIAVPFGLGILLCVVSGCYTYAAVEEGAPEQGADVRVLLTPSGARDLAERSGEEIGSRFEGTWIAARDDSATLRVTRTGRAAGAGLSSSSGVRFVRISVSNTDIRRIERRRFSALRTGLLAAGVGVGLRLFLELPDVLGGGGGEPMETPPPPPPSRWPW